MAPLGLLVAFSASLVKSERARLRALGFGSARAPQNGRFGHEANANNENPSTARLSVAPLFHEPT